MNPELNELVSGMANPTRSDQSIESRALEGVIAVQRIITERDGLRRRTYAQEGELNSLRAQIADFRQQLSLIQGSHVKFAETLISELREIDRAFQILRKNDVANQANREEAELVSLVERFSSTQKGTGTRG